MAGGLTLQPETLAASAEIRHEAAVKRRLKGFLIHIGPVSYTHLDVYKRQSVR